MDHLLPALAASATPRILELLPPPPARVLELGFAGIQAVPLRIAGFEVTVVEPDPKARDRAQARAGDPVYSEIPRRLYQAVIAPEGTNLADVQAERRLTLKADGTIVVD